MAKAPWWSDGLHFTCARCGNCCGGAPGFTWISPTEVTSLAEHLGLGRDAFLRRYTITVQIEGGAQGTSLRSLPDHDCVFFRRGSGCMVYEHRPRQCRTWPFWRRNLVSRAVWQAEAKECPGMGKGELHPAAAIAERLANDGLA